VPPIRVPCPAAAMMATFIRRQQVNRVGQVEDSLQRIGSDDRYVLKSND
jgi:hypothetical protein